MTPDRRSDPRSPFADASPTENRTRPTPAGTNVELAVDQLVGPIYYRVLVTGDPVPQEFTDQLVHQFLIRYEHRQ